MSAASETSRAGAPPPIEREVWQEQEGLIRCGQHDGAFVVVDAHKVVSLQPVSGGGTRIGTVAGTFFSVRGPLEEVLANVVAARIGDSVAVGGFYRAAGAVR